MNASKFIHIICWLVQNSRESFDTQNLQQQITDTVWANTKIRMQRWKAELGRMESNLKSDIFTRSSDYESHWLEFFALSDEIVLAESLTRVFTASIASKSDCQDVSDVIQDILKDSVEIKKRVLSISKNAPTTMKEYTDKTNELRVLNDHLVNLMLSQLPNQTAAKCFATNQVAFEHFANCAGTYQADVIRQANIALGISFAEGINQIANPTTTNEDINRKIAAGIADLFPSPLVDFPFGVNEPATV